jgi:hypothetical protein
MQFIALVFGFLVLFSILTFARLDRFSLDTKYLNHIALELKKERSNYNKNHLLSFEVHVEPIKKEESEEVKQIIPAKDTARVPLLYLEILPHNAKLNLAKIFKENKEESFVTKNEGYTFIFLSLLDNLYSSFEFYNEIPNTSQKILKILLDKSSPNEELKKIKVDTLEDLACLDIEDPKLKKIFYKILKGEGCVSVLQFLHLDPNRRKFEINIHHASLELIEAIILNKNAAEEIITTRNRLHDSGKRYTKGRKKSLVTTSFLTKEIVSSVLKKYNISFEKVGKYFEFSIAKPNLQTIQPLYSLEVDSKGRSKKLIRPF